MRAAIVRVSTDLMGQLLQLPAGIEVQRAEEQPLRPDEVSLLLTGEGLPEICETTAGAPVKTLNPTYRQSHNYCAELVDWGEAK